MDPTGSGGLVVWRSGGLGGLAVWWSGGLVVWWSGGLVVWWSGGLVVWWSGGLAVLRRGSDGVWWSGVKVDRAGGIGEALSEARRAIFAPVPMPCPYMRK